MNGSLRGVERLEFGVGHDGFKGEMFGVLFVVVNLFERVDVKSWVCVTRTECLSFIRG